MLTDKNLEKNYYLSLNANTNLMICKLKRECIFLIYNCQDNVLFCDYTKV